MKIPNMCPFKKNEKEVFFRITLFFQEKKFLSKEQLLFSFLCIVKQTKIEGIQNFLKIYLKKPLKGGISIYADFGPPKGQIISKGIFVFLTSPKKKNEQKNEKI